MKDWAKDSIFYHIYPLGFCGAEERNDFCSHSRERLTKINDWIGHIKELGCNALYLGPVFESSTHGYDTADYYNVDRRLGSNDTLKNTILKLHENGIKVVLDGVFHHVGRDFWAFKDLKENLYESQFCNWFDGLHFEGTSPYGDQFCYTAWNGHFNLVKLNLKNSEVKQHIFHAVQMWINDLGIDGLRLDAADYIDKEFLMELAQFCRSIKPDFWLIGEVIHGDYREWANESTLDSVTNYECYKGLYSSHNDKNYFEIAFSLDRQFGSGGLYRYLQLYSFADNHDVDRIASTIKKTAHLYPLYCMLFTMPGIPSIYYGSEWGIEGKKEGGCDANLRPALELIELPLKAKQPELKKTIAKLATIRKENRALREGSFKQRFLNHQQFAFERNIGEEKIVVAVNSDDKPVSIEINITAGHGKRLVDVLNSGESFSINNDKARFTLWPNWGRIMKLV